MGGSGASSKGAGGGSTGGRQGTIDGLPVRGPSPDTDTRAERTLMAENRITDFQYKGVWIRKVTDMNGNNIRIGPLYADQDAYLKKHGFTGATTAAATERQIDAALKKAADARKKRRK